MTTLFGIKNCDTVKKARKWLDAHDIDHQFHDVRSDGLESQQLQHWIDSVGYETLVNKRSTTWKQLPDSDKEQLCADSALTLMLANPTLIKRPVLELNDGVHVGFKDDLYLAYFELN
ncbi:arsenate reductase [Sinobacterium caligoides]|uniref:Arsenate reductase n=1 Tax=Sinobacterium caligoides TaxID=933926 RepID=A0A3N2DN02_9GAMM|nr:ArsC family reductase [Sinobacterium caligoides]ROS01052.1 arsenate reductase [Sinobacterium caligoides]